MGSNHGKAVHYWVSLHSKEAKLSSFWFPRGQDSGFRKWKHSQLNTHSTENNTFFFFFKLITCSEIAVTFFFSCKRFQSPTAGKSIGREGKQQEAEKACVLWRREPQLSPRWAKWRGFSTVSMQGLLLVQKSDLCQHRPLVANEVSCEAPQQKAQSAEEGPFLRL